MPVPGLHVVTNDEVLAATGFHERALDILDACGPAAALHLRGRQTSAARLLSIAEALTPVARAVGALLLVNDRVDMALAVDAHGVQLGRRSLPVAAARSLRPDWLIGASVHGVQEATDADDADFLVVGTIWETPSHPGREGAGLPLVREVRERVGRPVIAIGGVTPDRASDACVAGARGVAVIRGVWDAVDPAAAAAEYVAIMREATGDAE